MPAKLTPQLPTPRYVPGAASTAAPSADAFTPSCSVRLYSPSHEAPKVNV